MISCLMLLDDPRQLAAIIDEGIRRHPDYPNLYFIAAYADMPQWGGSMAMVEELARKAVAATVATQGKTMYARIYWSLYSHPAKLQDTLFTKTLVRWDTMRQGFEDLVQRYPDPWNLNAYAHLACSAGDGATFRSAMGKVGDNVVYAAWGDEGKMVFEHCARNADTMVGRTGTVVRLEDLSLPRRTLSYMIGGMERRAGIYAWLALVLAFVAGFALRAAKRSWPLALTVATLEAPVMLVLFDTGRVGMTAWAFSGAIALGSLLGACGVLLASVLARKPGTATA